MRRFISTRFSERKSTRNPGAFSFTRLPAVLRRGASRRGAKSASCSYAAGIFLQEWKASSVGGTSVRACFHGGPSVARVYRAIMKIEWKRLGIVKRRLGRRPSRKNYFERPSRASLRRSLRFPGCRAARPNILGSSSGRTADRSGIGPAGMSTA